MMSGSIEYVITGSGTIEVKNYTLQERDKEGEREGDRG